MSRFDLFFILVDECNEVNLNTALLILVSILLVWILLLVSGFKMKNFPQQCVFALTLPFLGDRLRHSQADCRPPCQECGVGRTRLRCERHPEICTVCPTVSAKGLSTTLTIHTKHWFLHWHAHNAMRFLDHPRSPGVCRGAVQATASERRRRHVQIGLENHGAAAGEHGAPVWGHGPSLLLRRGRMNSRVRMCSTSSDL